jgi:hypothetical protein
MPILLTQRFKDAWKAIPSEAYAVCPNRIGKLHPVHVWKAVVACFYSSSIFRWLHWMEAKVVTDRLAWGLTDMALLWHAIWAVGVLRRRSELDPRLVKFASYTFWPSLAGVVLLLVCHARSLSGHMSR